MQSIGESVGLIKRCPLSWIRRVINPRDSFFYGVLSNEHFNFPPIFPRLLKVKKRGPALNAGPLDNIFHLYREWDLIGRRLLPKERMIKRDGQQRGNDTFTYISD